MRIQIELTDNTTINARDDDPSRLKKFLEGTTDYLIVRYATSETEFI